MALRTFTAADGTPWNVWNVVPSITHTHQALTVMAAMTGGWLCFECASAKRRLVPIPDGWEELSDAELERVMETAELVQPRIPRTLAAAQAIEAEGTR
jgi:hypothetical protein